MTQQDNPPKIFSKWPPKNPGNIQLYSLATPNGQKIGIALEEMELAYDVHVIDIMKGDQFEPEYLTVSPNSKIPGIVDPDGPDGNPIAIMESGAILIYLADKAGKFIPTTAAGRNECLQWLFFQVGHIGPMFGQFGHFFKFAVDKCDDPYPLERYSTESKRLFKVLDDRLQDRDYILGEEFTIADMAIMPWVGTLRNFYKAGDYLEMDKFKNMNDWVARLLDRPALKRGLKVAAGS